MNWQDDVKYTPERQDKIGGQHVGSVFQGVWATHSSGLKVFCNTERSQHRNILICLAMLEYGLEENGTMNKYRKLNNEKPTQKN